MEARDLAFRVSKAQKCGEAVESDHVLADMGSSIDLQVPFQRAGTDWQESTLAVNDVTNTGNLGVLSRCDSGKHSAAHIG